MNRRAVGSTSGMLAGLALAAGLVLAALHTSCTPSRTDSVSARDSTSTPVVPSPVQDLIPPNTCRVRATIVAIDTSLMRGSPTDPCSKFHCRATVRIDSVRGYGSSFVRPLSTGETVSVTFVHTLAPTRNVYPEMKPELPGLMLGSSFVADIEGGGMGIGGTALGFTVRTYALVE